MFAYVFFPTSLCGVLVFDSVSRSSRPRPLRRHHTLSFTHNFSHTTLSYTLSHTQLCHTPSFTHNFVIHSLSHTTLSHTIFHTQFVAHRLSHTHTSLSHTIFHTQLCHTPSFTHIFVTHHLSHTTLSHTISHRPPFCLAGVAHMALGWLWWRAWSPLVARGAAALCVAGVAPGDIYRRFAWQAWRLATSTVLRGMRGTWRHQPWFCVAGVALGNIYANTQTSTQTSFTHTHPSRTHNLEHTHTPFKHTPFTHKLEHIHTSRHNAFIHNTRTQLFHTNLNTQFFQTQLCHSNLFHELEYTNFHFHRQTHNKLEHTNFHTQLFHAQPFTHNSFTRKLSHTTLLHTAFHTKLFYTQLFHTLPFTHDSFTYNIVTHILSLSHTALSHTTLSHTALSHTVLSHNLSSPSHFHTCFELVGRSWHVGLSGPLTMFRARAARFRRYTGWAAMRQSWSWRPARLQATPLNKNVWQLVEQCILRGGLWFFEHVQVANGDVKLCFKVQEQSITFNWTLAVLLALPMSSAKAPLVSACWHVSAPCQLARKMFMSGSASRTGNERSCRRPPLAGVHHARPAWSPRMLSW